MQLWVCQAWEARDDDQAVAYLEQAAALWMSIAIGEKTPYWFSFVGESSWLRFWVESWTCAVKINYHTWLSLALRLVSVNCYVDFGGLDPFPYTNYTAKLMSSCRVWRVPWWNRPWEPRARLDVGRVWADTDSKSMFTLNLVMEGGGLCSFFPFFSKFFPFFAKFVCFQSFKGCFVRLW